MGLPEMITNNTVDIAHTVHYAVGYLTKQVNPRLAMVTHTAYDEDLLPEILAGIRVHWDGLFQFGAPDGVVVNVTKDAVWTRMRRSPRRPARHGRTCPRRRSSSTSVSGISTSSSPTLGTTSPTSRRSSSAQGDRPGPLLPGGRQTRAHPDLPQGVQDRDPRMVAKKVGEKIKGRFGRN